MPKTVLAKRGDVGIAFALRLTAPGFQKIAEKTRNPERTESGSELKCPLALGQKMRRTRQCSLAQQGGNFSLAWFALRNGTPFIGRFSSISLYSGLNAFFQPRGAGNAWV
jgi:hypothetical protein